uniref:Saposin B-type domain-containing protein n=1 Tax=Trichuris muris TaxID=70415 RepID=A0A5S6QWD9_TRIMR
MAILFLPAAFFIAATAAAATGEERLIPNEIPTKDQCLICKAAVNIAERAQQNKLGKEYIIGQMKQICTLSTLPTTCEVQSMHMLPYLTEATSAHALDPQICDLITATDCAKAINNRKVEGLDCTICKLWTKIVANRIVGMSRQMKYYFEMLCNSTKLDANGIKQCTDLLEKQFDQAFQALVNMFVNDALCTYGHFCLTQSQKTAKYMDKTDAEYTCSICRLFLAQFQSSIDKDKFEENYLGLLRTFCSFIPSDAQKQCNSFVDTYAKQFMEDAIFLLSPDIFCPAMGLC